MATERRMKGPTSPAGDQDRMAVEAAVRDYFDGWFDGDVERMRRALHPSLAKGNVDEDGDPSDGVSSCTAEEMIAWTSSGNGVRRALSGRAYEIRIDEISADIAAATVHSDPCFEFLHLAPTRAGWQIVNALWRFADGYRPAN
ncbi:MAG: nuclear transport factor 2 family protein [Chloroflexota bacterium]|nr:nuclear transport factor 2 family protein [Chloroflexota bacterium]